MENLFLKVLSTFHVFAQVFWVREIVPVIIEK